MARAHALDDEKFEAFTKQALGTLLELTQQHTEEGYFFGPGEIVDAMHFDTEIQRSTAIGYLHRALGPYMTASHRAIVLPKNGARQVRYRADLSQVGVIQRLIQ